MERYLADLGLMLLCLTGMSGTTQAASVKCEGSFVNPIADAYWECIFPVTIDDVPVVKGHQSGAPNPSMPIQSCPMGILYRVGLTIGYRKPMALMDMTRLPYCMVDLGGFNINIGNVGSGAEGQESRANLDAFCHVYWYRYLLTYWLNIITSVGCFRGGGLDIGYLSEPDPTWGSSSLSVIIQPETIFFGNVIAQGACTADAVASLVGKPIDALFWCAGSQGSIHPLNGYVSNEFSPLQAFLLLSERMAFKLYRQGIVISNIGESATACFGYPPPIVPKNHQQYYLANRYPDAGQCHLLGCSVTR